MKSNKKGSALIMAIALVTMLAIVGALFLLMSRIEEGSTSSLEEFKSLDAAVDSVIATIATEIKLDTPGVKDANNNYPEYYDYPGIRDKWLASLEPYDYIAGAGINAVWGQISDVTNYLSGRGWDTSNVEINMTGLLKADVSENAPIAVDASGNLMEQYSDADGDGIADSKWVKLENISSSTGRPIYAAIRVVDNGGMLNVNTAYKFDADSTNADDISGRYLRNINLMGLSERNAQSDSNDQKALLNARNIAESNLPSYESYAVYNFQQNYGSSMPFDISDELKLRNRYIINYNEITTRIEEFWNTCFDGGLITPIDFNINIDTNPDEWFYRVNNSSPSDPCAYNYRHIATTYNVDRVIDPNGDSMFYIEDANDPQALYDKIKGFARDATQEDEFAQLSANIIDYGDNDCNVTISNAVGTKYGWEKPYIYISEIARNFAYATPVNPGDPCEIHREYGIELHNWYNQSDNFGPLTNNQYRLVIKNSGANPNGDTIVLSDEDFKERGGRFFVRIYEDDYFVDGNDLHSDYTDLPWDGAEGVDPDLIFGWGPLQHPEGVNWAEYQFYIGGDEQKVKAANSVNHPGVIYEKIDTSDVNWPNVKYDPDLLSGKQKYYWKIVDVDVNGLVVDAKGKPVDGNAVVVESPVYDFTTWDTPPDDVNSAWDANYPMFDTDTQIYLERLLPDGSWLRIDTVDTNLPGYKSLLDETYGSSTGVRSIMRELNWGLMLKKYWNYYDNRNSLGNSDGHYFSTDTNPIPPHNWSSFFNNVGEIGLLFRVDAYGYDFKPATTEKDVRIDLADQNVQKIFQYITRINPSGTDTRIKGRININTAPWYVLAQLPWVSQRRGIDNLTDNDLAKAMVAFRDKTGNYLTGRYTPANSEYGYLGLNSADVREELGFASIGELNYLVAGSDKENIAYYSLDNKDQPGFPDLSYHERSLVDGSPDDFEERNLIFARISDLVTVRSDVFTAYVLVRLGEDGPQRRIITILDRSEVAVDATGKLMPDSKVKIIAKYPVPDPR